MDSMQELREVQNNVKDLVSSGLISKAEAIELVLKKALQLLEVQTDPIISGPAEDMPQEIVDEYAYMGTIYN